MKQLKTFIPLTFFVLLSHIFISCSTKGRALLYSEPSIQLQNIKAKTVAILPNRYPVTLQNAEEYRRKNYTVIKNILVHRGFNVIDYNTSNEMFLQSGLPLEDTKSSRDKYAELSQKLNADLLIFPYYGTTYSTTGFTNSYIAVTTLQFYSVEHNDFCARIDMEGTHKVHTWPAQILPFGGIGLSFIEPELSMGGFVLPIIYNIGVAIDGKKGHDKAFKKGINEGISLFVSRFNSAGSGQLKQNKSIGGGSKYAKYSLEELETLKKAAVGNGDYKTAGEIKEEIDKRKK